MHHSMRLLEETDRKITDIAVEMGFTDGNYFAKIFRRKFAVSPREYRMKFRSGDNFRNNNP